MTAASEARRDTEIFPNAPLQLVAVELTYPPVTHGFNPAVFAAVQAVLGEGTDSQLGGQMRLTGLPVPEKPDPTETMLFRMTNAERTVSVSAWPTSYIVECSEYERFESFRDLVRSLVDAYTRYTTLTAVSRFGMRYIDEVHVDSPIASIADWAPYVHEALVAPLAFVDDRLTNLATAFTADLGGHRAINVRCATTPARAVNSEGPLRLRARPDTPAFVLDIDAVFQPIEPMAATVDGSLVAEMAASLRPGVRKVFDSAFTELALETFRRVEGAS